MVLGLKGRAIWNLKKECSDYNYMGNSCMELFGGSTNEKKLTLFPQIFGLP